MEPFALVAIATVSVASVVATLVIGIGAFLWVPVMVTLAFWNDAK